MKNDSTNEYNPETVSLPGDTLAEMLEERGMTQAELCDRIGRPRKTVNEILKGKAAITADTAIQFEHVFGVSATFWNNRQREYDESLARSKEALRLSSLVSWLENFPCLRDMMNRGWIPERKTPELVLDAVLSYFGVNSPDDWDAVWGKMNLAAALRDSEARTSNSFALAAYLRKAEVEAAKIECPAYSKTLFKDALKKVRSLSRSDPANLNDSIVELCATAGVKVVFIPLINGVHLSGAVRWVSKNYPIMAFSCRGKTEDIFWFSFFHESAHIILHGNIKLFIEVEGTRSKTEEEADTYAGETLIPDNAWRRFAQKGKDFSRDEIECFAQSIGICTAIVLGRLQHEGMHPRRSYLNHMKRPISYEQSC